MRRRYLYTITRSMTKAQHLQLADAIGPVQPYDIGKQVFNVDGVIQVENEQQRATRLQAALAHGKGFVS